MLAAKLEPVENYPGNKVAWKCKCLQCGKIVSPSLGAVRNNGGGCKPCNTAVTNKRKLAEAAKLAILDLKSFNVLPRENFPGSKKKWHCYCSTCGHDIYPAYSNIKNGSHPCVYCAKKKIHPKDAELILKKSGLEPLTKYPGSTKPWKSKHIACGEIVAPRLSDIVQGQGGCKECGYKENQRKQLGDGELARNFFLSKGFKPLEPYPGSSRPWRSKCLKCGFIVQPYYGRVRDGIGCGVCSKKIVVPQEAVKVMLKAKLKPLEPFPGSKKNWSCLCLRCNRKVSPAYGSVLQGDGGCKYCGGHFIEPEAAVLLMKSRGLTPLTPYKNSGVNWKCICNKCKREVSPSYNQIQQGQGGCSYCARRKVDPKEAKKLMIDAGATPLVKFPGARKPWKCRCNTCGRVIKPLYSPVANQGYNPCNYCAGKKVDAKSAFQVMLNAGLTPLEKYKRADTGWRCICNKCKKIVMPRYSAIRSGQGGCKYCTDKGLDYNAPAFLYLMTHGEFGAHKIGIGNYKTRLNRIDEHKKMGWVLIENLDFSTGEGAYQCEQAILLWLQEVKKLRPYLSESDMPQRGWTETFDASEIDLPTIWAKVKSLSRLV